MDIGCEYVIWHADLFQEGYIKTGVDHVSQGGLVVLPEVWFNCSKTSVLVSEG